MEYESPSGIPRQRPSLGTKDEAATVDMGYPNMPGTLSQMLCFSFFLYVWEAGSKQVKDTLTIYGRLDIFRPYFNVMPRQVRSRLIQSLIPKKPSQMSAAVDFYGPLMINLTLVALLLFSMKSSGYVVQDGTLMGTALVTCFSAWFFMSVTISAVCYVLSTDVSSIYIFSAFGYSLFSHCVVTLLSTLFHLARSHLFFYILVLLFCVPSAARVSLYLCSKTRDSTHKLALAAVIFVLHIGYICYLHFGFHEMVEEIDEMLNDNVLGAATAVIAKDTVSARPA